MRLLRTPMMTDVDDDVYTHLLPTKEDLLSVYDNPHIAKDSYDCQTQDYD